MEIIHTIGRRKASVARVYLSDGKGEITINGKDFKEYFPVETMQFKLRQPFNILDLEGKIDVKAKKTKSGQYSTSEETLQKLAGKHPIIEDILNFRQLKKLKSTYVGIYCGSP